MVAHLLEAHEDKTVVVFLQLLKLNSGPSHYLFINWNFFLSIKLSENIVFYVPLQSLSVE